MIVMGSPTEPAVMTESESRLSQPRPRVYWVDSAKGYGIVLVVLGHVLRGLALGNIIVVGFDNSLH